MLFVNAQPNWNNMQVSKDTAWTLFTKFNEITVIKFGFSIYLFIYKERLKRLNSLYDDQSERDISLVN